MKIPIENIYYLLCYAWNKLDEDKIVNVNAEEFKDLVNLFAKVLYSGCLHLFKRGFDRNYIPNEEEIRAIKGKLLFTETLKRNLLIKKRAVCSYDEFHHNVLHNRIIKSTMEILLKHKNLNEDIKISLYSIYPRFHDIDTIRLSVSAFNLVQLHRNNFFYDFLLKICLIIYENLLISEEAGKYKFKEFIKDEEKLADLFQNFVLNFYKIEFPQYKVSEDYINWNFASDEESLRFLPRMHTDITIQQPSRTLIIDTKYYSKTLSYYYDKKSIHSSNLYQLFSYINNYVDNKNPDKPVDGILLYPVVDISLDLLYKYRDSNIMIKTVNLSENWKKIEDRLKNIIT